MMNNSQNILEEKKEIRNTLYLEINKRKQLTTLLKTIKNLGYRFFFDIDDTTWQSNFRIDDEKKTIKIKVGAKKMSIEEKIKLFYNEQNFSDKDIIIYKTIHELSHVLVFFVDSEMVQEQIKIKQNLLQIFDNIKLIREHSKKGLTTLGNFDHYRNKNPNDPNEYPSREDLVELMTMYIYDYKYFEQYLTMLNTDAEFKKKLNLANLNKSQHQNIIYLLDSMMQYLSKI